MNYHKLKCAYCDSEFESKRNDALFCCDTCRASSNREKKTKETLNGEYAIKYSEEENRIISGKASSVGMSTNEYIKFISMNNVEDYVNIVGSKNELLEEYKKLKAKLSFYTDDFSDGLFLDIDEQSQVYIVDQMCKYDPNLVSIEEFIIYVSLNLDKIILETVDKVMEAVEKKRFLFK